MQSTLACITYFQAIIKPPLILNQVFHEERLGNKLVSSQTLLQRGKEGLVTSYYYGLAVALKAKPLKSVGGCAKEVCKGVMSKAK